MNHWRRFWIGGGGALLPLLVTLLAIDLANIIDHFRDYTIGTYVGTALRYLVLFALGGIVAALNSDEMKPIKLVQLGIAAPALIASYVNAQPAKMPPDQAQPRAEQTRLMSLDFISSAYAMEKRPALDRSFLMAGFLSDVLQSATRPLPNLDSPNSNKLQVQDRAAIERAIDDARQSAARAAAAAKKAAADADKLNQGSSPSEISTVQKSANDSLAASQKATSDVKALDAINRSEAAK